MNSNIPLLAAVAALCVGSDTILAQNAPVPAAPPTPVPALAAAPATPAPPEAPEPPAAVPEIAYGYAASWGDTLMSGGPAPSRTLVIPKDAADANNLGDVEEDMNVMAHILDKVASGRDDKLRNAMGIVIHSGAHGAAAAPRNLYLDGYGAVFFLNVNYPLRDTATKAKDEVSKEDANSEWEEARRELARPGAQNFTYLPPVGPLMDGPAEAYDAERVEILKTDLVSALKNAAHIRRLKPGEDVTVVVTGRGAGSEPRVLRSRGNRGTGHATIAVAGRSNPDTSGASARLVLRAKKSDIEALQKDQLSLDDFRKKVTLLIY